ncbi:MAG: HK97 gp10 family phage protein [Blastocatellia bacterium]|nr:HK97 gp10 family phage protein [Blastocatellia bacterium]HMW02618.1 HK97 gp10 family phage protein [Acidobacteriota bacterium]
MPVKLTSKIPQLVDALQQKAAAVVRKTAFDIQASAVTSMAGPKSGHVYGGHQAAGPGEPPAVDTGVLRGSIQVEQKTPLTCVVRTNTEYAAFQEFGTTEMPAHPFLLPAVEKARPGFQAAMSKIAG